MLYAVLIVLLVVQGVANKGEADKCRDLAKVSTVLEPAVYV